MELAKLLTTLQAKLEDIRQLQDLEAGDEEFTRWKDSTHAVLRDAFGEKIKEYTDFAGITYAPPGGSAGEGRDTPEDHQADHQAYLEGLTQAESLLEEIIRNTDWFHIKTKTKTERKYGA